MGFSRESCGMWLPFRLSQSDRYQVTSHGILIEKDYTSNEVDDAQSRLAVSHLGQRSAVGGQIQVSVINTVGESMNNVYTAVVKRDGDWWIGWIEEVPGVNCQESSRDELLESLKMTLREALEFNKQDAIAAAGGSYQEELIPV
jgi:predicted RNase H-like HicB family nuclease